MTPPERPPLAMTREAFIARWRRNLAGLALFGVASDVKDSPLKRAAYALDIPAEVERLLGQLYDDLAPKELPAAAPHANGTPHNGTNGKPPVRGVVGKVGG